MRNAVVGYNPTNLGSKSSLQLFIAADSAVIVCSGSKELYKVCSQILECSNELAVTRALSCCAHPRGSGSWSDRARSAHKHLVILGEVVILLGEVVSLMVHGGRSARSQPRKDTFFSSYYT